MRWWLLLLVACGTAELEPELAAKYEANCAACHEAGAADAPMRGDEVDWAARRERRGLEGMLQTLQMGNIAMPAKGLCFYCTDEELEALARYVSNTP